MRNSRNGPLQALRFWIKNPLSSWSVLEHARNCETTEVETRVWHSQSGMQGHTMRLRRFQFYSRTVFSCKVRQYYFVSQVPIDISHVSEKVIFCQWIYYRIFSTNKIREFQTVRFEIGIRIVEKLCCESAVRFHNFFIVLSRIICFHSLWKFISNLFFQWLKELLRANDWSIVVILKRLQWTCNATQGDIVFELETDRWSWPLENCSDDIGKTHQKYLFIEKY